jgi:hypothetical protein
MEMVIEMVAVMQRFPSPQMKLISDVCVSLFFGISLFVAAVL